MLRKVPMIEMVMQVMHEEGHDDAKKNANDRNGSAGDAIVVMEVQVHSYHGNF